MSLIRTIGILSIALLVGGSTARAQSPSLVGDYHGTALIGDTSEGSLIPIEFVQSVDLALKIERVDDTYTGSLSFRRLYLNLEGRLADAQGPLDSLVISGDRTFTATSSPIRFLLDGRLIERIVSLEGTFNVSESDCIPTIEADYSEVMYGLVFKPLDMSGSLSMARARDTQAADACLGDPLTPPQ